MRLFHLRLAALAVLTVVAAGCNGGGTNVTSSQVTFKQIERWGRPAVKEAFEMFDNHDTTNRSTPTNDPVLPNDIVNFTTTVAGRSQAIATTIQSVLIPDEMAVDLSQPGPAAYLGVETKGATGSKFGGRGLPDDVIDISLGIIFGKTLTTAPGGLGLVPDDGKETPCLTTDNVGPSTAQVPTGTFPYLQGPY